jgi:hypothetical protein
MSCRKAFEADIAAFLLDPGGPEWAELRGHYPRCPDCATEIRAWTELHTLLESGAPGPAAVEAGSAHPDEELLLQFEEHPERLASTQRQAVADHLATCRSCADELGALRRFDFARLEPAAPASMRQPRVSPLRLASLVRRVVLHPAFAYAVVLLLLYPTVAERFFPAPPPTGAPVAPTSSESPMAAHEEGERGARSHDKLEQRASPAETFETLANAGPQPEGNFAAERPLPAESARGPAVRSATQAAPRKSARDRLAGELLLADRPALDRRADLDPAVSEPEHRASRAQQLAQEALSPAAAGWSAVTLEPHAQAEIAAPSLGGGILLRVPVAGTSREGGTLQVRVLDSSGRREIRERVLVPTEAGHVEMRLPAAWVLIDTYRIELHTAAAHAEPAATFSLRVR